MRLNGKSKVSILNPDFSLKPSPGCRGVGWLFFCAVLAEEFNLACPVMKCYHVVHQVGIISDFPLL